MQKIAIRQLTGLQRDLPAEERFKIRRVEDIALAADDHAIMHPLHKHDFFFMLALQTGTGIHEIDFVPYTVTDESVFFLRPGQVHQLQLQPGCSGYLMEFNASFYQPKDPASAQRLRKASTKNYCKLATGRFDKIASVLENILQELTTRDEGYQHVIRASLDIFFVEYIRQSAHPATITTSPASYSQERFETFVALLDQHIAALKQVSQYSHLMNLSAYQLNEVTKTAVGKTASELINAQLVLEAKRYLLATSNQIKEVADLLGYEDASYFIRFFKKHTGQSPEAFRKNSGKML